MQHRWDGSNIHDRSKAIRAYLGQDPEIQTVRLPACAPAIKQDDLAWAWTKYGRLGNLAAQNSDCVSIRSRTPTE